MSEPRSISPEPSRKRVAVFLDGTWNTVNDNTNVWRMKSLCAPVDAGGVEQRIYYNSGVGTKFGEKVRGGILGYGLNENIIDAYEWLIDNYNPGDDLFIFGFSRGAYTARSLSGLISKCGLLEPGAPLSVSQLYARYRLASSPRTIRTLRSDRAQGSKGFDQEEQWMLKYSQAIDIEFIGVWDTVGSLGIPFGNIPGFGRADMQFLNTGLRTSNKYAFHALAIDEHRQAFAPTLWTKDTPKQLSPDTPPPRPLEQVEQRWFVGAHANVGGGYQRDALPQPSLKWMMEKAGKAGLSFRKEIEVDSDFLASKIADSYDKFMHGLYKHITSRNFRAIGQANIDIATSVRSTINETIDASVFARWNCDTSYRPPNLQKWIAARGVKPETLSSSVLAADATPVAA